jgi:phytoene synthase
MGGDGETRGGDAERGSAGEGAGGGGKARADLRMPHPAVAVTHAARVREGYAQAARVVRDRAGNFYFAFLGQPPRARRALHAIYAFCREADDATDDGRHPADARRALAGLRRRLSEVYDGAPADPLDCALQDTVHTFALDREDFLSVLAGVERDLTARRYPTFEDLRGYCFQVAASVGLLCLPVFGRRDALARERAIDLGIGMQLTNILRDLAEDGRRGRIYVPQEDLHRFGVREEMLLTATSSGAESPAAGRPEGPGGNAGMALEKLLWFEVARARSYLASGRELLPLLRRADRFCPAVLSTVYGQLLDRIEQLGAGVLRERVSLPGWRKLWLAARVFTGGNPRAVS